MDLDVAEPTRGTAVMAFTGWRGTSSLMLTEFRLAGGARPAPLHRQSMG